jgi:uncharacterized protein
MRAQHLPAYEFQRQRWANGQGWTREIAREPPLGEQFEWRASIAEIDRDGAFSRFPGCRRSLWLLEGAGMHLRRADGNVTTLQPPQHRLDFDGDEPIDCSLLDGPVRAFNLIYRSGEQIDLLHRPLVGPMVFFDTPGSEWLIYLARGRAELRTRTPPIALSSGDAVRLVSEGHPGSRQILDGGGELLLLRISRPQDDA